MVASVSPAPAVAATWPDQPSLGYRPGLDAIRGIAVLLVMLHHTGHPAFKHLGTLGVCLFFALSGFLITSILRTERETTGRVRLLAFYGRRGRRLLPAFLLFVAAVSLAMVATGQADEVLGDVLPAVAYHANFYGTGGELHWMSHAWTLAIEEQFYLVWPFVVLLTVRLVPTLAIAVVAVVAIRAAGIGPTVVGNVVAVADSLLLGCLLASVSWRPSRVLVIAAAVGLALWAISPLRDIGGTNANLPVAVGVTIIVGGAAMAGSAPKPLIALGLISYGVYLWHFPLFMTGDTLDLPLVAFGPLAAVTILIAWLSYRCVERPLRTLEWRRLAATRVWWRPRTAGRA